MGYKATIQRELKRFNLSTWIVSFIMPLMFCLLICVIFAKGSPTNLPIGVFNQDNSEVSRTILRNLEALPSVTIKYEVQSLQEGEKLLRSGKVYGFITIEKDFQKKLYTFKQPKLLFYYNNQRVLAGGIISKEINSTIQSMLVGIDAKIKSKAGLPTDIAIKQSNLINIVDHIRSNPYFNYQYFLSLIAFGHTIQMLLILVLVWSIGKEFKFGTTKEWLQSANNSILIAFLGKATPYFAIFIGLFAILYFIYFILYGAPYYGNIFAGIIATILFIITCFCVSIVFISINGNLRYALSASAFYVAMGFAFAGITFPVMAMPLFAQLFSATMPLNYWIKIMIDQSLREIPVIYNTKYFIALIIITTISLCFLPRLKALCNDENRWHQE